MYIPTVVCRRKTLKIIVLISQTKTLNLNPLTIKRGWTYVHNLLFSFHLKVIELYTVEKKLLNLTSIKTEHKMSRISTFL